MSRAIQAQKAVNNFWQYNLFSKFYWCTPVHILQTKWCGFSEDICYKGTFSAYNSSLNFAHGRFTDSVAKSSAWKVGGGGGGGLLESIHMFGLVKAMYSLNMA